AVEFSRDTFDIQRFAKAISDFEHRHISVLIEFSEFENNGTELAQEEITGLALDVVVIAGKLLAAFPFNPIPNTSSTFLFDKYEQSFVMSSGNLFVYRGPNLRIRDNSVLCHYFKNCDTRELGNLAASED